MGLFWNKKDKKIKNDKTSEKILESNEETTIIDTSNDELISIEVLSSEFSIEKYRKN